MGFHNNFTKTATKVALWQSSFMQAKGLLRSESQETMLWESDLKTKIEEITH